MYGRLRFEATEGRAFRLKSMGKAMTKMPTKETLRSVDSLLCNAKEILDDAFTVANDGGQGETTVKLAGLAQALTDVQAELRAQLASKEGR